MAVATGNQWQGYGVYILRILVAAILATTSREYRPVGAVEDSGGGCRFRGDVFLRVLGLVVLGGKYSGEAAPGVEAPGELVDRRLPC